MQDRDRRVRGVIAARGDSAFQQRQGRVQPEAMQRQAGRGRGITYGSAVVGIDEGGIGNHCLTGAGGDGQQFGQGGEDRVAFGLGVGGLRQVVFRGDVVAPLADFVAAEDQRAGGWPNSGARARARVVLPVPGRPPMAAAIAGAGRR